MQPLHTPNPHPLDAVFATPLATLLTQQSDELAKLVTPMPDSVILFGTGFLGKHAAARLRAAAPHLQLYFCDNNPAVQGEIEGIRVLPKEAALRDYARSALFVVTIFNGQEVFEQLQQAGCAHVVSYATLYRAFGEKMLPLCSLDSPEALFREKTEIYRCYDLLADEESRSEFLEILSWHVSPTYFPLSNRHRQQEIYYSPTFYAKRTDERYVDCGAFDGDSIRYFMDIWKGEFSRIAGFEPIAENFSSLEKFHRTLPEDLAAKIEIYPYALSTQKEEIRFSVSGTASSAIHGEQSTVVQAVDLDSTLAEFHPTLIKMDIEGAEPLALTGAQNILKQDAPVLSICLYHDIRHLWQIPLLIHRFNPNYRLYLRRYAQDCWETVCYAVPPERHL